MHDTGLLGIVVVAVELVVVQPFPCTVGSRGDGAASAGAADHLGGEVVDRYGGGSGWQLGRTSLAV